SGQTIAVTGKVGNEVKASDVVTVKVGTETYQTTVNTDGKTWPAKTNRTAFVIDFIISVFQPLVPAIAGGGVLKSLLLLL
ncbi:hypothetical protein NP490_21970, partial [Pectobacterium carotovorum]|nr:hypothetical protein [Pectobacterium carotovorum]